MTIRAYEGPRGGAERALHAYEARRDRYRSQIEVVRSGTLEIGDQPRVSSPLPVYRLTLKGAQRTQPLSHIRPSEWWYLLHDPGPVTFVRMKGGGRSGLQLVAISHGHLVEAVLAAAQNAQQRWGERVRVRFVPRILDIPALAFRALWLHGRTSDHLLTLSEYHGQGRRTSAEVLRYIRRESGRALRQRGGQRRLGRKPVSVKGRKRAAALR